MKSIKTYNSYSRFKRTPSKMQRWISLGAAAVFAVFVFGQSGLANAADRINVILDQAKVLQLPPNTATIIVGNPMVAGVTMINGNTQLILTGKSFGQTNMIALDNDGNSIGESTILVKGSKTGLLVQRGMRQETYSCEPRCRPTVTLGDNAAYSAAALGAATRRTSAAQRAAKQ